MTTETQQLELRWTTMRRIHGSDFRTVLGGALKQVAPGDWDWLFNHGNVDGRGGSALGMIRFAAGTSAERHHASVIAIGDDACGRLSSEVMKILQAVATIDGFSRHPVVDTDVMWWKRRGGVHGHRLTACVLPDVRGDKAHYDSLRANPTLLIPSIRKAVASGIARTCAALGFDDPGVAEDDVEVTQVGELGTQPVRKGGRSAMLSRLRSAEIVLPVQLHGDWRVGTLVSYGNGLLRPHLEIRGAQRAREAIAAGAVS